MCTGAGSQLALSPALSPSLCPSQPRLRSLPGQAGAALQHCEAVPMTLCQLMADSPLLLSVSLCPEPLLPPSCFQEAPRPGQEPGCLSL